MGYNNYMYYLARLRRVILWKMKRSFAPTVTMVSK